METIKACTWCWNEKPLTDFHRLKRALDGRSSHCKVCHRKIARESFRKQYTGSRRLVLLERGRKRYAQNPRPARVGYIVWAAIACGKLVRLPCEECQVEPAQAHHDDYDKPLDVRWLCGSCHSLLHRRLARQH